MLVVLAVDVLVTGFSVPGSAIAVVVVLVESTVGVLASFSSSIGSAMEHDVFDDCSTDAVTEVVVFAKLTAGVTASGWSSSFSTVNDDVPDDCSADSDPDIAPLAA